MFTCTALADGSSRIWRKQCFFTQTWTFCRPIRCTFRKTEVQLLLHWHILTFFLSPSVYRKGTLFLGLFLHTQANFFTHGRTFSKHISISRMNVILYTLLQRLFSHKKHAHRILHKSVSVFAEISILLDTQANHVYMHSASAWFFTNMTKAVLFYTNINLL